MSLTKVKKLFNYLTVVAFTTVIAAQAVFPVAINALELDPVEIEVVVNEGEATVVKNDAVEEIVSESVEAVVNEAEDQVEQSIITVDEAVEQLEEQNSENSLTNSDTETKIEENVDETNSENVEEGNELPAITAAVPVDVDAAGTAAAAPVTTTPPTLSVIYVHKVLDLNNDGVPNFLNGETSQTDWRIRLYKEEAGGSWTYLREKDTRVNWLNTSARFIVPTGDYVVCEVNKLGYSQSFAGTLYDWIKYTDAPTANISGRSDEAPSCVKLSTVPFAISPGPSVTGVSSAVFGNSVDNGGDAQIRIHKLIDENENMFPDFPTETRASGWTFRIYDDAWTPFTDSKGEHEIVSTSQAYNLAARFEVPGGDYYVCEVSQTDYSQSYVRHIKGWYNFPDGSVTNNSGMTDEEGYCLEISNILDHEIRSGVFGNIDTSSSDDSSNNNDDDSSNNNDDDSSNKNNNTNNNTNNNPVGTNNPQGAINNNVLGAVAVVDEDADQDDADEAGQDEDDSAGDVSSTSTDGEGETQGEKTDEEKGWLASNWPWLLALLLALFLFFFWARRRNEDEEEA